MLFGEDHPQSLPFVIEVLKGECKGERYYTPSKSHFCYTAGLSNNILKKLEEQNYRYKNLKFIPAKKGDNEKYPEINFYLARKAIISNSNINSFNIVRFRFLSGPFEGKVFEGTNMEIKELVKDPDKAFILYRDLRKDNYKNITTLGIGEEEVGFKITQKVLDEIKVDITAHREWLIGTSLIDDKKYYCLYFSPIIISLGLSRWGVYQSAKTKNAYSSAGFTWTLSKKKPTDIPELTKEIVKIHKESKLNISSLAVKRKTK